MRAGRSKAGCGEGVGAVDDVADCAGVVGSRKDYYDAAEGLEGGEGEDAVRSEGSNRCAEDGERARGKEGSGGMRDVESVCCGLIAATLSVSVVGGDLERWECEHHGESFSTESLLFGYFEGVERVVVRARKSQSDLKSVIVAEVGSCGGNEPFVLVVSL